MIVWSKIIKQPDESGQSFVETALFLPILIFMLLGIVEVSNLLMTQNRVTTASRMAAGFGASNYDRSNFAVDANGTAFDMGIVALNTITQTMDIEEALWDVYSVRAKTTMAGDGFDMFETVHVYGTNAVVTAAEWAGMETDLQASVLEALQSACESDVAGGAIPNCASDIELVVSLPFHNIETILGIPLWQWTGFQRMRGFTVMRVKPLEQARGCPLLPITVRLDQYSIYPSNWDPLTPPLHFAGDPVDVFPYPAPSDPPGYETFTYPQDPFPSYNNLLEQPLFETDNYVGNNPGIPLWQVMLLDPLHRGALFWAREEGEEGNFGWLSWGDNEDAGSLADSLQWPGNFRDDAPAGYVGSNSDMNETTNPPPITGDLDGFLESGEWITNGPGNMNKKEGLEALQSYVDEQTEVALVVFDVDNQFLVEGPIGGSNIEYHVYEFISVHIVGYKFTVNSKWMLFEYVSNDVVCGRN